MPQGQQNISCTISQLEQLCQAAQIERTMSLLFALNHWAKARDRLFFADRQGLYQVKAALLRQAHALGMIEANAYIDGRDGFGAELAFDVAADIAAEGFLWRLEDLVTSPERGEDAYMRIVRQLYTEITGKETIEAGVVEALEASRVHEYILERLRELERQARITSQPIPCCKLTELCIAPSDFLYIQDRRYYDLGCWDSWNQLDASDLRKLDPEGLSLIAFGYSSPVAHYVFHLPFRLAETFVPPWFIALLKSAPLTSRERGEYYGRPVTEAESFQQPIADILRELGVDILATCPRQLREKEDFMFIQAMHATMRSSKECGIDEEENELDEVFWQRINVPEKIHCRTAVCPLCANMGEIMPGLARVEHWRQEHPGQDLTVSQASWVLNQSMGKEEFCQQYPPDYRVPHEHGWGTRYWKAETLGAWLNGVGKQE